tara:strand:+ start:131 stop:601 length:471 start_codon:yes stop_codon:yes gene_type:complete
MELLRSIIKLIILLSFKICVAQEDTLRILDDNAIITSDINGKLYYLFKIKSKNPDFQWDSYKFIIPNQKGFDEYYSVHEMQEEVDIDSINSKAIKDLSKEMTNWEIHNFLSKKRKIYLINNKKPNRVNNKLNSKIYYSYPLIYQGTQKNIEVLNLH